MKRTDSLRDLPKGPAVYALCTGSGRNRSVSYVGETNSLRHRINEHLVRKNSSVTTGQSAVQLNTEFISEILWWEDASFREKMILEAAEIIATEILDPIMRSNRPSKGVAVEKSRESLFIDRMHTLFTSEPHGILHLTSFQQIVDQIKGLEERVIALEKLLKE